MLWGIEIHRKGMDGFQFGSLPDCAYEDAKRILEQIKSRDQNIEDIRLLLNFIGQWKEIVEAEGTVV